MVQRKHRRTRDRRPQNYSDGDRDFLLQGRTLQPAAILGGGDVIAPGPIVGKRLKEIKTAWYDLRDELLPAYIAKHPGERPAAWWWCEAPEARRRIVRGYDVAADPTAPTWVRQRVNLGVTRIFGAKANEQGVVAESQAAYLDDRHGLLSRAERDALGPDFDREEVLWRPVDDADNGGNVPLQPAMA